MFHLDLQMTVKTAVSFFSSSFFFSLKGICRQEVFLKAKRYCVTVGAEGTGINVDVKIHLVI